MTEKGLAEVGRLTFDLLYAWHAQAVLAGKESEQRRERANRRRSFGP